MGEAKGILRDFIAKAGGEGSRGGKIIGHTKSGRAVYEGHGADSGRYAGFKKQDHRDAAKIHAKRALSRYNSSQDHVDELRMLSGRERGPHERKAGEHAHMGVLHDKLSESHRRAGAKKEGGVS